MKKSLYIIILLILQYTFASSQIFTLFDIDASAFPLMKAKFYLIDGRGNQISNFSLSDFRIAENGAYRQITQITCPEIKPALALSTVLVMDASGSMGGLNIYLAKTGAAAYISGLRNNRSETAITVFDDKGHIVSDFSTNTNYLLSAVEKIFYNKYGWTDYNSGLIIPNAGALNLLNYKSNKKIIVFLSDGKPTTETLTMDIVNEAVRQGVKIYSVAIRMSIQDEMRDFSELTGGLWFDNIFTEDQAKNIYSQILEDAQGENTPCTIEWISESVCEPTQVDVRIENSTFSKSAISSYKTPPNAIAKLQIIPKSINYSGQRIGIQKDTTIIVTAQNHDFVVTDITSSNNNFDISPKYFDLKSGESKNLTVSFTPKDSAYAFCEFKVISDKCPEKIYASGGWPGKVPPVPTLKLTHPNGGEIFVVGSDTVITWVGVTPTDTVALEYSTNSGVDWSLITTNATGLKYDWKNIPKPSSDSCLVRVNQQGASGFEETATVGGSSLKDSGKKIVKDNNGNLIVVGNISGSANISGRNILAQGRNDYFIAKYNDAGNLLWVKTSGLTGIKSVRDVDVDASGNIYTTGEYNGTVFVSKYDANGGGNWTRVSSGNGAIKAGGVAADKDGNVTITGSYSGNISFVFVDLQSSGGTDVFITKYDTSGDLKWVKTGNGIGNIEANDVADDKSGNSIIVGNYTSNADFGNQSLQSSGNEDIFVLKIDASGLIQWAKSAGGAGNEFGLSISCDSYGNPVIAGGFKGIFNFGANNLTSRDFDAYIGKMDKFGNFLWASSGGGVTDDFGFGVASDPDGSSALTGYITGDVKFANVDFSSLGGRDVFVTRYDAKGNLLWAKSAGGTGDCAGNGITFDFSGQLATTGSFNGTAEFGTRKYDSNGEDDYFLWRIKYQALQSDTSDSLFAIVQPIPAANSIDMRLAMYGSVKDSVVTSFIRNNGNYPFQVDSIYFKGDDSAAFDLVSGFPKYIVEAKGSMFAEFRFKPLRVGAHNAEMIVITQSDTLLLSIRGIGVQAQIQVVNPIIDFGIVQVGDFKDTIQTVTVKNIGNATLYITETKHGKPNDVDFTTLAGGGAFNLKPNEEAKMDLRFFASQSGVTEGTLEFHYSGVGSPAVIQLYGEGLDLKPRIVTSLSLMPDIICENNSKGSITISNEGINSLIINDISIIGTDANNFFTDFSTPLVIERDSIEIINLTFNPTSSGTNNASLIIKSNSAINPELEIPISATKDSIKIIPLNSFIDLGYLCPNQDKDTVVIIKNLSTIPSSAILKFSNNIELSESKIDLDIDEEIEIKLRYKAGTNEGVFNEIITITDENCKYEYQINVVGDVRLPVVMADDIIIQTYIGQPKDGEIIIKNIGLRDIVINSAPQVSNPYQLNNSDFPLLIPAGQERSVSVLFTPLSIGYDTISIDFYIDACSIKLPVQISTTTGAVVATIALPEISEYAGKIISVPLMIKNPVNLLESGVTGFDIDISYNRTLLAPLDYNSTIIDANSAEIRLLNLKPSLNEPLTFIRFMTGLGNSESTPLKISNIKAIGSDANIQQIDGLFTLLGICYEGGSRLLNSEGNAEILQISPNPSTANAITLSMNIIEKGAVSLMIYNSAGSIKNKFDFVGETGLINVQLDTSNYESGVYFIHLSTPTISDIRKLVVVK